MSIILNAKPADLDLNNIDCPYIKRVFRNFADNITMLTIQEFIHKSKYPIDSFMVDNFFVNLNDDVPIYVTNELIEWCGYSGNLLHQKESFKNVISNFKEGTDYWVYSNKEYFKYYENHPKPNYPHPNTFAGKNKTKHMILSVQCFKMILMMLTTKKANEIRLYYIGLERLIKVYAKYQLYCQVNQNKILKIANIELNKKMDKQARQLDKLQNTLNVMNNKLDRATDERAPKTANPDKRDEFLVLKLNKRNYPWHYYAVRCQTASVMSRLATLRVEFPRFRKILQISYQPNSKNLYNLMRENLGDNIETKNNYIKLITPYTEREFIRDINDLNNMKKDMHELIDVPTPDSEDEAEPEAELEVEPAEEPAEDESENESEDEPAPRPEIETDVDIGIDLPKSKSKK